MKADDLDEVRLSLYATVVFAVTAFGADFIGFMEAPGVIVALALFVGGAVAMGATLVIAASRSRRELVDVGGLFFLTGSAPKDVRNKLMAAFVAQCVIGIASAALRPYTSSAFGVLAPVAGLGLAGLWAARHGTFPERPIP